MKLSYDWLCDFVDLSGISVEKVAEKLTMGAFEVEEITQVGPKIEGPLKVGEIVEINPHPNADKIRMTKTRVEEDGTPLDIVCGAANIEVGQRIPVALPGSKVINRKTGEELNIIASEIRGVKSNGMLCSPPELGITDGDSEGILILDKSKYKTGEDLVEKLCLKSDWILHVEPRSNRGDALCIMGLAREVAALFERPFKSNIERWDDNKSKETEPNFELSIEDTNDCKFFTLRLIKNIKVGPSPAWMVRRLEAVGLRTVNNVVDITNYVMLETGQPLHAYDLDKLSGKLSTKRAQNNQKVELIDGKERELSDEIMIIADGAEVAGVAGVMGGKDSEISEQTQNLALEAACFSPKQVRRASRILGLSSDSSHRFERGVDLQNVKNASDRASLLISEHAKPAQGEAELSSIITAGSSEYHPHEIKLRNSEVERLLGIAISNSICAKYLNMLGFEVESDSSNNSLSVKVPSFRAADVTREVDLIEEVCRLFGYDNIENEMPSKTVHPPEYCRLEQTVRSTLAGQGLSEAWISSLRPETELDYCSKAEGDGVVRVLNPLSKDHQILRQTLIPGLLETVKYNQDHGNKETWLFEVGRTYQKELIGSNGQSTSDSSSSNTGAVESTHVAAAISGSLLKQFNIGYIDGEKTINYPQMQETVDFFRAKGLVENLLEKLNVDEARIDYKKVEDVPGFLHPYRSCQVSLKSSGKKKRNKNKSDSGPEVLGWIGELHPKIAHQIGIKHTVQLFELDLDKVKTASQINQFQEPAQTPNISRDLTADLDIDVEQADVIRLIRNAAGKKLDSVDLVSIFDLSETRRSLSYRLSFQEKGETLTNEEVEKRLAKIRNTLSHQLSATFRA